MSCTVNRFVCGLAVCSVSGTGSDVAAHCDYGVVGAGWAGVYAAWRLVVDSSDVRGKDLCIFEAMGRPGGRTHTTTSDFGLKVDLGAMRFSEDMHLPADLIAGPLKLKSVCFDSSCTRDPSRQNATLRKIVDDEGHNAGFGRPIAVMLEQLQAEGVRVMYNSRLTSISETRSRWWRPWSAGVMTLEFAPNRREAMHATVNKVFLNMPRNAILNLTSDSLIFKNGSERERIDCTDNSEMGRKKMAVKAYLSYADAWWATQLNLTEGRRVSSPNTTASPLVQVRYNGASHAKCLPDSLEGPVLHSDTEACPGVLEVCDDFELGCDDVPGLCWYLQFQADPEDSSVRVTDPAPLKTLHEELMRMHAEDLAGAGLAASDIPEPTELYLGIYLPDAVLQPVQRMLGDNGPADYACLGDSGPRTLLRSVAKPLDDFDLFIANNDFWYTTEPHNGDWAYASLASMERLLHEHIGLEAPAWLDSDYYTDFVLGGTSTLRTTKQSFV